MQVASTLWPSRKTQKISEYRFRLKWTKCSPRTEAKQVRTGQPQRGSDKEAQTSPTPSSWGRLVARVDRPTYRSAAQAHGPHRLNFATWHLPVAPLGRFGCYGRWLPPINTREGVGNRTHTHLTSLTSQVPSCIVFRLSGV